MKQNMRFSHESLQDTESVKDLLKALTNGIAKGKVVLEDGDGSIIMEPKGLLRLKISANQDDEQNRINLKISWQNEQKIPKGKNLIVSAK